MGSLGENDGASEKIGSESFTDTITESRGSSSSTSRSSSDVLLSDERSGKGSSSPTTLGWPIRKALVGKSSGYDDKRKLRSRTDDDPKLMKLSSESSETNMMERFSKLLLGEDMSGSGKGVCSALAISNAITNLFATVLGQIWRLESLPIEKKEMWRKEMEWLLCVSDHIVELIPSWQTFPNGTKLEVMTCKPRSDLRINLPALRKLDNMLIEILDSFSKTEFWYVDKGVVPKNADGSSSVPSLMRRQDEKWWLPVPRVPPGGLSDDARKQLNHKRECTNQILKASMAINSVALAEMEVPESYLEILPKNGRSCLGDVIYRYITSDHFSSECLLDCFDLSSEHIALDIANRVEAAIHVWRRRNHPKPVTKPNRSISKSSWEMMKDFMVDGDKRELLAERADRLLFALKQRVPCLTQTSLDTSKIQFNKDVGKSILESYSRVLESLAFNIIARIDDLIYIDDMSKQCEETAHIKLSMPYQVSILGTPYKTASSTTPCFSPAPLISPTKGERTPFVRTEKLHPHRRGLGVKRVLTNYLGVEPKVKINGNSNGEVVGQNGLRSGRSNR